MIASLTFTYGNERHDIFKYKKRDYIDQLLRSELDYNLYIFHINIYIKLIIINFLVNTLICL